MSIGQTKAKYWAYKAMRAAKRCRVDESTLRDAADEDRGGHQIHDALMDSRAFGNHGNDLKIEGFLIHHWPELRPYIDDAIELAYHQ